MSDIIRACTCDNVQPLVLVACEQFGTTVAMCLASSRKIEDLIRKVTTPTFVKFLGAHIGYSADDSAVLLSRSLAGVRFLALVAPLVSTMSTFDGALALEEILRKSAVDITLLPTVRQLQDLLVALEHRLIRSGFGDLVLGWERLLPNLENMPEQLRWYFKQDSSTIPDKHALVALVDTFRALHRIGDAISVTLKTRCCTAWVIAFTQWCLGTPPHIVLEDGTSVFRQSVSQVTVVPKDSGISMQIIVQHSLGSPTEQIDADADGCWSGLISVRNYGNLLLSYWVVDQIKFSLLVQVLPTALHQVVRNIRLSAFKEQKHSEMPDAHTTDKILDDTFVSLATKPFPIDVRIRRTAALVLGEEILVAWSSTSQIALVKDIPAFQAHMQQLREECQCPECNKTNLLAACKIGEIMEDLAAVVADVLCLSLFDDLENLLLAHSADEADDKPFTRVVKSILEQQMPLAPCDLNDVLQSALALVGHTKVGENCVSWMMSSYRGQAVYLKLFEKEQLTKPGFLTLSWAPGVLKLDGDIYHEAHSAYIPELRFVTTNSSVSPDGPPTPQPKLIWDTNRMDGYLELTAKLVFNEDNLICTSPRKILRTLSSSLILAPCSHRSTNHFEMTINPGQYTNPDIPFGKNVDNKSKKWNGLISVVVTNGNSSLRMCALALQQPGSEEFEGIPYVFCGEACLQCALEVCRKAKYPGVMC